MLFFKNYVMYIIYILREKNNKTSLHYRKYSKDPWEKVKGDIIPYGVRGEPKQLMRSEMNDMTYNLERVMYKM